MDLEGSAISCSVSSSCSASPERSSTAADRMVRIEMEAAEALADLADFARRETGNCDSGGKWGSKGKRGKKRVYSESSLDDPVLNPVFDSVPSCSDLAPVTSSQPDFGNWLKATYGRERYNSMPIASLFSAELGKLPVAANQRERMDPIDASRELRQRSLELLNLSEIFELSTAKLRHRQKVLETETNRLKGKLQTAEKEAKDQKEALGKAEKERDQLREQLKERDQQLAEAQKAVDAGEANLMREMGVCVSRAYWWTERIHTGYRLAHPQSKLTRPNVTIPSVAMAQRLDSLTVLEQTAALEAGFLNGWKETIEKSPVADASSTAPPPPEK